MAMYLIKKFTRGYVLWIKFQNHQYKVNRKINGDCKITILACEKLVFSTSRICGHTLNTFWGGVRTTKLLYRINGYTKSCIILFRDSSLWHPSYFIGNIWHWFHRRQGLWNVANFEWRNGALPWSLYIWFLINRITPLSSVTHKNVLE